MIGVAGAFSVWHEARSLKADVRSGGEAQWIRNVILTDASRLMRAASNGICG